MVNIFVCLCRPFLVDENDLVRDVCAQHNEWFFVGLKKEKEKIVVSEIFGAGFIAPVG